MVIVGDERQENANIGRTLTSADLDGDGFRDIVGIQSVAMLHMTRRTCGMQQVVGAQYAYGGNGTAGQAPSNPYDGTAAVFLLFVTIASTVVADASTSGRTHFRLPRLRRCNHGIVVREASQVGCVLALGVAPR